MAKIGDKSFTVTFVEDSDYTQGDEVSKGVKLTTKETFEVDGKEFNKFHTTRVAIVSKFSDHSIREDINENNEPLGPIKCVTEKSASGKDFFNLVDV